MLMNLIVKFQDPKRQPEEPMGEAQEFDSMEEFISFNIEQAEEIVDDAPEYQKVIEKLQSREFTTESYYGITQVIVADV